jgi:hypothetical protein
MKDQQSYLIPRFEIYFNSYYKPESQQLLLIKAQGCYIRNGGKRMDMGINGDESNVDAGCAPFLFQSFYQVTPPLLKEGIIS